MISCNSFIYVPDIDECALGEDNCHDTLASCTDIVGGSGSFECACITGYTGDGVTCTSMSTHIIISNHSSEDNTCSVGDNSSPSFVHNAVG